MIKVDVVSTVNEIKSEQIIGKIVIVIDVLRASSTIIAAFLSGCKEIIPVETSGQAFSLKKENILLAGERFCKKIQGFDFSNSPTEINQQNLSEAKLVLTTTNGTCAIHKSKRADHVFIGSFLNGPSVIDEAKEFKKDITILCAGTRNEPALEDLLCAGYLINELIKSKCIVEYSDFAYLVGAAFQQTQERIADVLPKTTTGKRLVQMGLNEDLSYCAAMNTCSLVPYVKDERIFVHPYS